MDHRDRLAEQKLNQQFVWNFFDKDSESRRYVKFRAVNKIKRQKP